MRLSKASYFAGFAVYPPVVLALLILALGRAPSLVWVTACQSGLTERQAPSALDQNGRRQTKAANSWWGWL
jgi:hypothetical protein